MSETSSPSAKVICDSISEQGHRLVTMEVVMHRFILAEMNTHRAFSRNSASSRAIPLKKTLARLDEIGPALPVKWPVERQGMQGGVDVDIATLAQVSYLWGLAARGAKEIAQGLGEQGLHKSLCNRLLEPFMWHTAIISATEWDNFFWQRCDPAAQPEMKAVADEMQRAYYTSIPKELAHGEWHMPYIYPQDWDDVKAQFPDVPQRRHTEMLQMVSVARCARVSYLTHDGVRSLDKDFELYNRLVGSGHWSPFEHVASPIKPLAIYVDNEIAQYWSASNFIGWKQFRKDFRSENRQNFVPNLPDLMTNENQTNQSSN